MIRDVLYFLVGVVSEALGLYHGPSSSAVAASQASSPFGDDVRVLARFELSSADQMEAVMTEQAPVTPPPEPKHFDAVLLLAHGTPDVLDEMDAYLKLVTGGRGVPQHVVHELQERYAQIGLKDEPASEGPHLTRWTLLQGRLLSERIGTPVYVGMRNWKPFIAAAVEDMKAAGVKKIRALCLAPQNSRTSVGLYRRALETAADGAFEIDFVAGWSEHPLLVRAFAEQLRKAISAAPRDGTAVLFTAHSVPCRTIQAKPSEHHGMMLTTEADTYAIECKRTAALVADELAGTIPDWFFCFQSQGISGGPWIGPSVEDTMLALRDSGYGHVILQPIGFLCDHVEILYDIDIAFQKLAAELSVTLSRPESLNDSPTLIGALADLARRGGRALPPRPAASAQQHGEVVHALAPLAEAAVL